MDERTMTRRDFSRLAAAGAALPVLACGPASGALEEEEAAPRSPSATARADLAELGLPTPGELGIPPVTWEGYRRAVVIDALASPGPFNVQGRMDHPLTTAMVANAAHSGITAVNVTVSGGGEGDEAFVDTVRAIAYFERELAEHPRVFRKIRSVADLDAAKAAGQTGLILGFQDTTSLGTDVKRLDLFDDLGVKIIQLTYNMRNAVGDGCLHPENQGLTDFGREVVAGMDDRGMLVDLSHCGQQTTADGIAASRNPVSITHSGCSAVFEHPRSKPDELLRALAERGGVVGIYLMPFLNAEGPPQAEHLYAHIEHALDVCGEDHVGIGSDASITPTVADEAYMTGLMAFADERARLGIGAPREHEVLFVEGLNHASRMGLIADGLLARGHSVARVEKVVGENWARLFGEVWG